MRDDAVLRHALPLGRGLGRNRLIVQNYKLYYVESVLCDEVDEKLITNKLCAMCGRRRVRPTRYTPDRVQLNFTGLYSWS